jgi:membrane protein
MQSVAGLHSFSVLGRLFVKTYREWNEDQAPRLGAALAYYTVLSLAPLLILMIATAGLVFGRDAAQGQLFGEIRGMVGSAGAAAIEQMVQNASKPGQGIVASLFGFATLLFGASSVTAELRNALNVIWDQRPDPNGGIKDVVKERSWALFIVLGCGFLLVVSLLISSALAAAGKYMSGLLPVPPGVMEVFNSLLSLVVLTGVFAVLFKYLPDARITWRDVFLGAAFTAALFTLGKLLIGLYLGKAGFGSTYGAAGSLVIVLVWVYYSAQIFFFGAEFTQVYAQRHRSTPPRPEAPRK